MTGQELLSRLRAGDAGAFDTIFRTWYAPLVRLAEGMLRERAVAEEIVQDVMLELWRRRDSLTEGGTAQAYLFQSTRNRALNQVRHRRVRERGEPFLVVDESRAASAEGELVEAEIEAALREAMDALPPRCREVLELSRARGLHAVAACGVWTGNCLPRKRPGSRRKGHGYGPAGPRTSDGAGLHGFFGNRSAPPALGRSLRAREGKDPRGP
jgi:RNA polymerase sigma-70 factor (ECF subfamily)